MRKKFAGILLALCLLLPCMMPQAVHAEQNDMTLYTLHYDANGGAGAPEDQTVRSEKTYVEFTVSDVVPIRQGYSFLGWAKNKNTGARYAAGRTVIIVNEIDSTTLTLYACWKANAYTVILDDNLNSSGQHVQQFDYDQEQKLQKNTFYSENMVFDSWNTERDGSGKSYQDEETVLNLTDQDQAVFWLYAQWKADRNHNNIADEKEEKYSITYTDGVENEEIFKDQVTQNLLAGDKTPAFDGIPVRKGYSFVGWTPEVKNVVEKSAVYQAIWEKNETAADQSTSGTSKKKNDSLSPETGVESHLSFWTAVFLIGLSAAICSMVMHGKKKTGN